MKMNNQVNFKGFEKMAFDAMSSSPESNIDLRINNKNEHNDYDIFKHHAQYSNAEKEFAFINFELKKSYDNELQLYKNGFLVEDYSGDKEKNYKKMLDIQKLLKRIVTAPKTDFDAYEPEQEMINAIMHDDNDLISEFKHEAKKILDFINKYLTENINF